MLDQTATYRKTAAGAQAIASRPAGLTPRQRSMLILVDGRRGWGELARLAQMLGDPAQLLEQLLQQGLIESARPGPASEPAAPAPSLESSAGSATARPAPLGPTELRVPLQRAQQFAVERLSDLLGPAGEDLCAKLQATRSPQEFRASVRRTETVLRALVGPELAAQFTREVENLRA
jgi:hypothetical protein